MRSPARAMPLRRRSKYGAIRTTVDGITFASRAEARMYSELKLRQRAHEIDLLRCQPRLRLVVNGQHIGDYVADFTFLERDVLHGPSGWTRVWLDVKGVINLPRHRPTTIRAVRHGDRESTHGGFELRHALL